MVAPEDLIAPRGLVELFMFPGEDRDQVGVRLGAYIDEAVGKQTTAVDAATTAWAYYRAFTAVVLRLSTLAEQVDAADEHSHRYGSKQADRLREMAAEQLAEWNVLTAAPVSASEAGSGATAFQPTW